MLWEILLSQNQLLYFVKEMDLVKESWCRHLQERMYFKNRGVANITKGSCKWCHGKWNVTIWEVVELTNLFD